MHSAHCTHGHMHTRAHTVHMHTACTHTCADTVQCAHVHTPHTAHTRTHAHLHTAHTHTCTQALSRAHTHTLTQKPTEQWTQAPFLAAQMVTDLLTEH